MEQNLDDNSESTILEPTELAPSESDGDAIDKSTEDSNSHVKSENTAEVDTSNENQEAEEQNRGSESKRETDADNTTDSTDYPTTADLETEQCALEETDDKQTSENEGTEETKKRPIEDNLAEEPAVKRVKREVQNEADLGTEKPEKCEDEIQNTLSPTASEEDELLKEDCVKSGESKLEASTEDSKPKVSSEDSRHGALAKDLKSEASTEDSKPEASAEDSACEALAEDLKTESSSEDSKPEVSSEDSKPEVSDEDSKPEASTDETNGDKSINQTDLPMETDETATLNEKGSGLNLKAPKAESEKDTVPVNGKMMDDDDCTRKSDDSEKENINADLPMDLSTRSSAPSDVITLSDDDSDEDARMNGFSNGIIPELSLEEQKIRRKLIKKLQSELRNEEAKLVLLKKMRQSQATQQLQDHSNTNFGSNKQAPAKAHAGQPPPLIRGNQSANMSSKSQNNQTVPGHMRGQGMHQYRSQMQGPPPLVMAPRMGSHLVQPSGLRGGLPPGAAPPSLMPGFRGPHHQQSPAHSQNVVQHQQQQVDNQTPAQRQAAAKLALRKQLEKTLLQIPPPKPPPPEMNFIPSLVSNEFIMLVGLEEVVNYITDADLIARGEKSPDEKLVCTPFTCIQCDTDFTPVWKREKPGSKNVICEMCVTTNQKKALKQEHTNRLKSAFVKALQQEQEIERMQSQTSSAVTTAPTPASPATTAVSMTAAPSFKSSAHVAAAAAEQLRHHQNFIQAHQAHQAHLRATQPLGIPTFNPRSPFHYQIPFKHSDLQRQYLLDMIPSRSMAQSNIGWKS